MQTAVIRPLGSRVLIKPYPKRTESAGGLAIVEDYQPDTGGTVIALGDGIESRKRAVQRFADRVIAALTGNDRDAGSRGIADADRAADIVAELADDYQPEHVCQVGDEVTFGVTAGTEIDIAGELYLLVDEDALETIAEPLGAHA